MSEKIPRVQYLGETEKQEGGKVIQVRVNGLDYLLVQARYQAGAEFFHGNCLEILLTQLEIRDIKYIPKTNFKFPIPKEERYELIGAGVCIINGKRHTFIGDSGAYNVKMNRNSLADLVQYFPVGVQIIFADVCKPNEILGTGEGKNDR